jgi:hypothetical protein
MKKINIILIIGTLAFFSCSGLKVISDHDQSVDFTKFKTYSYYGWTDESDQILNRFDKERIENAFGEEFEKRNLKFVEKDGDIIVSLFIVIEEKTSKTAYTNHYNMGGMGGYYDYDFGYSPGFGMGMGTSTTHFSESEYEVGTLVCDVFSSETKKLIWQGIGTGTVSDNPEANERGIPKAVAYIMKKYPVNESK